MTDSPAVETASSLHTDPPLTPTGVLLGHRGWLAALIVTSVTLAVLAAIDGGSMLAWIDEPIQRWTEAHRSEVADVIFRSFSRLGSTVVIFGVLAVLLVLLARRCPILAIVLAVAVLTRPVGEFLVKALIDRPRPDLDPLINGTGPSHPSGHVLAAMLLWGLLPPIAATFTNSRRWWWASVVVGAVLVVGIGASRVYLGVHWATDVIQGILVGALYLIAVDVIYTRTHRDKGCRTTRNH